MSNPMSLHLAVLNVSCRLLPIPPVVEVEERVAATTLLPIKVVAEAVDLITLCQ